MSNKRAIQFESFDVVGWTDAGIDQDGSVGLGWIIMERSELRRVVAMGYVFLSGEDGDGEKDSTRSELIALRWAMRHLWHVRTGEPLAYVGKPSAWERGRFKAKVLRGILGEEGSQETAGAR